jgi:hypothetical protein
MKTQKYNPISVNCWFRYTHINQFPFSVSNIDHGLNNLYNKEIGYIYQNKRKGFWLYNKKIR